jgi:hypothetical protein
VTTIEDFVAAARDAADAVPTEVVEIAPAGVPLRIHLTGRAVIDELTGPLLLAEAPAEPVAEFRVFDSAESGVMPPAPPWPPSAFQGHRGEIAGFNDYPQLATYDHEYATLSFYDADANAGVQWFRDASKMAPWEGGSTVRHLIRWALSPHDANMVHAAAVGGALICGPSGAGKSTTALACALAGLPFTSDDLVITTIEDGPVAHAIYANARATKQTHALIPELDSTIPAESLDWRGKSRHPMGDRLVRSQALSVVVLPEQAQRSGPPRELSPADALRLVSAGNVQLMPGATTSTLSALTELLDVLPAYALPIGPDLAGAPEAIADLAELGARV